MSEIQDLAHRYPWVHFYIAENIGTAKFGRPVVSIGEFYKYTVMPPGQDFVIINSDIMLTDKIQFKEDGIGVGSRYDYDTEEDEAEMKVQGFDYFYIPYKYVSILKDMDAYYMGICWWDYVLPLRAINAGIKLYHLKKKIAFHKSHEINYSAKDRRYMEQVVMALEGELRGFRNNIKGMNVYCYTKIISKLL
jgi:hypothetical protein